MNEGACFTFFAVLTLPIRLPWPTALIPLPLPSFSNTAKPSHIKPQTGTKQVAQPIHPSPDLTR